VDFVQKVPATHPQDGVTAVPERLQKVSVPVLALVPLRPLAVQEAEFNLAMEVTYVAPHQQTRTQSRKHGSQASDAAATEAGAGDHHDWYLVPQPISLRGHIAPSPREDQGDKRLIKVQVKMAPVPMPSGLEKLLTTLTQSASVTEFRPAGKE
jgi:hypothetical protein